MLSCDGYIEILNKIETIAQTSMDMPCAGAQLLIHSLELSSYCEMLKEGFPEITNIEFTKVVNVKLNLVEKVLNCRIDTIQDDVCLDNEELLNVRQYFDENHALGYNDLIVLRRMIADKVGLLAWLNVTVMKDICGVVEGHLKVLDRCLKDVNLMGDMLNMYYENYRDGEWRSRRQELAKMGRLHQGDINFWNDRSVELEQRLGGHVMGKIHNRCCDDEGMNCDYRQFVKLLFASNMKQWTMDDLYSYFDIILTMEFVEVQKVGRVMLKKHRLMEIVGVKEGEEEVNPNEALLGTIEGMMNRIGEYFGEKCSLEGMKEVLRHMMTDEVLNDRHGRMQRMFCDFVVNKESTRKGEFMDGVSIQNVMRLVGVLWAWNVFVPDAKVRKMVGLILDDRGDGKESSYMSYVYKGKNELYYSETPWMEYMRKRLGV